MTAGKFDPLEHGLNRSMLDNTGMYLNTAAWDRSVGEFVGTCRVCGDNLVAEEKRTEGKVTWRIARCINAKCKHEYASPEARILRRSSRHDEMPTGFWAKRTGTN